MNGQQIDELATICTRFADLRTGAKTTQNNLTRLRFAIFSDMVTTEELNTLRLAEDIIERIASNTSQRDAVNHFNSLQTTEQ